MRHSGNELINPFKTLERAGLREGDFVADLGCGVLPRIPRGVVL
jgi:hypothetical protein